MMTKRAWLELDETPEGKWVATGYIVRDDPRDPTLPEVIVETPYPDDALMQASESLWGLLPTRGDV